MLAQPGITSAINKLSLQHAVLTTVHFDRQGNDRCVEIENKRADRVLPAKADAFDLGGLKTGPELPFRGRRGAAQPPRAVGLQLRTIEALSARNHGGKCR